ncbi:MAG: POTRA domain-containing protein, partial [Fluviibacter sp.]
MSQKYRLSRKSRLLKQRIFAACFSGLLSLTATGESWAQTQHEAEAFRPFVVRDIRVEGLQRTEPGTVFTYLPIKVGETVDAQKITEAIRALYATGFFKDVRIEAIGNELIVTIA